MEFVTTLAFLAFGISILSLWFTSSAIKKATKEMAEFVATQNKVLAGRLDEVGSNHAGLERAIESLESKTKGEFARTQAAVTKLEEREAELSRELGGIRAHLQELGGGRTTKPITSA